MKTRTEIYAKQKAARLAKNTIGMCRIHGKRPVVLGTRQCQKCLWGQQEQNLKAFHKISIEDYAKMELAQDRKCAICRGSCPSGRDLAVDHDHKTGTIRGLLCMNCNQGIGKFKENPEFLDSAKDYLRKTCR